ncbi:MAG: alpha/beta hydrolase [Planctomycetota bacterium]|nr:MAG: alpha/beta hydrolase [Planctomycetota bacterium]REJ97658.1 MAG: alpha/beta hydrolase [Planctomycetota bacterium]REK42210.1 MAG: alpha/beta hydrolase [Planctomycetota bacterium]
MTGSIPARRRREAEGVVMPANLRAVMIRRRQILRFAVGLLLASLLPTAAWAQGDADATSPRPAAAAERAGNAEPATPAATFEQRADVEYVRHGTTALLADLFVPTGEGPFPGVLMVHGGAWRHGSKEHCSGLARQLVERGYSVMTINYRLAPRHKFPAQLIDCVAAVHWLHSNATDYKVDRARLGAWGYSAGGQLVALMAAMRQAQREQGDGGVAVGFEPNEGGSDVDVLPTLTVPLRAIAAGGAPTDFRTWLPEKSEILTYWLGKSRAERPRIYELASPRHFLSRDDPPMFFFHGEYDYLVPAVFARKMVGELTELGVPAEFHVVPHKGHVAARFDQAAQLASFDFLDRHLKGEGQQERQQAGEGLANRDESAGERDEDTTPQEAPEQAPQRDSSPSEADEGRSDR